MRMWLVQRGKRVNSEYKGLTGKDGLVNLDYMGSAEFEWGAIPRAYRRIMSQYSEYVFHKTDLINVNGCSLWIYAHKDNVAEVEECIKTYLKQHYTTKEWTNLEEHFNKNLDFTFEYNKYCLQTNFWWDINNDWIAFVGAEDVRDQYIKALSNDYNDWWMAKTEEERATEIEESFN